MNNEQKTEKKKVSRRAAIKYLGISAAGVVGVYFGVKHLPLGTDAKEVLANAKLVIKRKEKIHGVEISLLGFGLMRLPLKNKEDISSIDEELALKMIDYAYNHGVNYFDTAWFYHRGMSETFAGKALKKYPRESFYLATKLPTPAVLGQDPNGLVKSTAPLDRIKEFFKFQLERCQVNYIDFYFLHSLRSIEQFKASYVDSKGLDYLLTEKEAGRIKRLGFSFHGPKEELPKIADQYKWDFCMIQNNYFDWEIDGKYLHEELEKRGIQTVIMEPVRGGLLATLSPAAIEVFTKADPNRSVASWAIQWCASLPNVMNVLSGMTEMEHVVDNVKTMTDFKPMTQKEYDVVNVALDTYKKISPVPCSYCDYCIAPECPAGIHISNVFKIYNECVAENNVPNIAMQRVSSRNAGEEYERQKRVFLGKMNQISSEKDATRCTMCNECLPKCPQNINITEKIQEISNLLKELRK